MDIVYVAYMWRDYRKENEAEVLGVYKLEETAVIKLRQFAERYAKDYKGTLKKNNDFSFVVECGDRDFQMFATEAMKLE